MVLVTPDMSMAEVPMVNLVQLLSDLTVDGYLLKI
jgi:hypothetical protein